ncbi:isocitrate lyase/phosphoenolpyruvate mutase family protein [Bradyrhizobium barranii subsp. apii]|uniref:isocitrate lyase/PEP mutase family protein n=1 Tax=Bradyrhizobium barranii TaxID=2992140 RepID=UPI001AA185D5|nr:isocitrate lyase/phosphoenolpyruvate mutase family protein [Bradyrhizobium barranii]UPU00347.1 isocitrate lyase/phosphoenolpyruvate mutase family protein [Bradyrhizobium barranii subsp. apii]
MDRPVSIDFEGGYSDDDATLASNIARLLDLGIVGINFEDRVVKGKGRYSVDRQAGRITAVRKAAERKGVPLFINARTDVFLGNGNDVGETLQRGKAYAAAGASGYFVPGVLTPDQIGRITAGVPIPVNVMVMEGVPSNDELAKLRIARISYGAIPYAQAMDSLRDKAGKMIS